ncbi:hypothetical protein [Bradyrhizobium sp. SZCCHNS2005]|uniref:hypothetical protein n=1 Tax=Bradyrhizobium sp. SZCCHNS2005 TaxID=3057303 RepID=UPI0028F14F8C|nr:hypothetical protein [Bradyrhizobium sp. SZCCHNS2005]
MIEINAKALSKTLDRPASSWTPASLHRVFLLHGCAVVRGAVDCATRTRVKQAIDTAYLGRPSEPHVYDTDITTATQGAVTGWELAVSPLIQDFLKLAFSGQSWKPAYVTARRIQGMEANQEWQQPLELHLDSQFHGFNFTVNFWVPFDTCGVDAPSLQLVPLDYHRTREFSQYTGQLLRDNDQYYFGYFRSDLLDPEASTKGVRSELLLPARDESWRSHRVLQLDHSW